MNEQYIAYFIGKQHQFTQPFTSLFEAQAKLLGFVKSPKCKDVPPAVKKGIKNYPDLAAAMNTLSVDGTVDAFVLRVRQLNANAT
jgi:hypothetical protein